MLERTAGRGGYALGTGNSVPDYVPDENYFAMIRAGVGAAIDELSTGSRLQPVMRWTERNRLKPRVPDGRSC